MPGRSAGYLRRDLKGDVLHAYYRYREVDLLFFKEPEKPTQIADGLAEEMLRLGLIDRTQLEDYRACVARELSPIDAVDELSSEAVYSRIQGLRRRCFGAAQLERYREILSRAGKALTFDGCIDQWVQLETVVQRSDALMLVLTQPELLRQMQQDLSRLPNRPLFAAVSPIEGEILPTASFFHAAFENINITCLTNPSAIPERTAILFYGEDGLHHCRGLKLPAMVTSVPRGYCAQALVNQLGMERPCRVYVPAGLDLTPYVRLLQKSRLTYSHLAGLAARFGEGIYDLTPEELYRNYPDAFLNIYETTFDALPLPIKINMDGEGETFSRFDRLLEQGIQGYLDGFQNVKYLFSYFDENLQPAPVCYDASQPQKGILVHGVRVKQARGAQVLRCPKGVTPRQMFRQLDLAGTGIISNFLFFMTEKLGTLYNTLRADRPCEQADAASGHLDYMLCHQDGRRIETFPLFRKTCVAMDADGRFLFFNFRLGGGSADVNGERFAWDKEQVDREDPQAPVLVYTPYYSCPDREADRDTYHKEVGAGRVNLIVLQDRITCVRRGDVILPSAGVVISLRPDRAKKLLGGLKSLEDGYYDVSGMELSICLEHPEEVSPERWEKVQWAYGGGLSLILDGQAICDGDMDSWFDREGWMSPLSRQTQESGLHTIARHPRTAIGVAENGDLVILVFSGRTWRSVGADYIEMCRIARTLVPDIRTLMNADGGGSAMLGMTVNGSFMELSCPSTSTGSCVGMVRPINTVFYIPAGERKEAR